MARPIAFRECMSEQRMNSRGRFRIADDVISEIIDGEAVILDAKAGVYFTLNRTATCVWQVIEEDGHLARAREEILRRFKAPDHQLDADLERHVSDLLAKGLIVEDPPQ